MAGAGGTKYGRAFSDCNFLPLSTGPNGCQLLSLALLTAGTLLAGASQANAQPYIFTDLGRQSFGRAINNAGQVAGYSFLPGNYTHHATLWNGTEPTDLGTLGGSFSLALGINNAGQVAGYSELPDHTQHATVWSGIAASDLGTPAGSHSEAQAINDTGQVAGAVFGPAIDRRATIWNGTTATDLGTLGGRSSVANDINNAAQVVGYSYVSGDSTFHATIWDDGMATDLGTLGGSRSEAHAINDAGLVVGWASTAAEVHAMLWNDGMATDLNSFLDASMVNAGWVLERAYDINDNGWIIGEARIGLIGENHAFLLTPIPEPETYVMFLAGLGLMTVISRRRKVS